jgi:flagellin-like hook-associated protein FlgL
MDFLGESLANTGSLRNMLQRQLETQLSEYTNMAAMTSNLLDADLAVEISNFARTSILQDAGVATLTHNLQSTSLMSLIDSNLSTEASSGIANVSALAKEPQA